MKNIKSKMMMTLLACFLLFGVALFAATDASCSIADAAVLKQGSSGSQVKTVQTKLRNWGYMTGSADGIFGAKTKAGVISFQKKNGLSADGVVGTRTASMLGITLSNSGSGSSGGSSGSSGSSGSTSSDLSLLARVIYGEARGEPYTGQVAVAAVVMNRVRSSSFPNTIAGVVYQPGAFDCVSDGQINLTPNDSCKKAAQDAINGWDPSYGCLYYYNPKTATNAWMLSRTVKLRIGLHNFC